MGTLYSADLMHCHAGSDYPQLIASTKVAVRIAFFDTFSITAGGMILADGFYNNPDLSVVRFFRNLSIRACNRNAVFLRQR